MSDLRDGRTAERERHVIVFGLAIIAAYLLAVLLPDLIPASTHRSAAQLVHARVISIVQATPGPSDQPLPSDAALPSGEPLSSDQPGAPSGDQGIPGAVQAVVVFLDGPLAGQEGTGIVQGPSGAFQVPDSARVTTSSSRSIRLPTGRPRSRSSTAGGYPCSRRFSRSWSCRLRSSPAGAACARSPRSR
jgi:hypothetical protein